MALANADYALVTIGILAQYISQISLYAYPLSFRRQTTIQHTWNPAAVAAFRNQ
jgi:hypothetical protein